MKQSALFAGYSIYVFPEYVMRFEDFDIIHTVYDSIAEFQELHGHPPRFLTLSPAGFSWLCALAIEEERLLGHHMLDTERWTFVHGDITLHIEIDETADDFGISLH